MQFKDRAIKNYNIWKPKVIVVMNLASATITLFLFATNNFFVR